MLMCRQKLRKKKELLLIKIRKKQRKKVKVVLLILMRLKMKEKMLGLLEREEEMNLTVKMLISAKKHLQPQLPRNLLQVVYTQRRKKLKLKFHCPYLCKHEQCVVNLFSKSKLPRPNAMISLFLKMKKQEVALLTKGNVLKPKRVVLECRANS